MEFTPILKAFSSLFPSSPFTVKDLHHFTVMILSPHPDDESINGALALRLQKENGAKIINVAVTLGSKKERQSERLRELKAACKVLDMELTVLEEDWKKKEKELKSLIQKYRPSLILAPHVRDRHPTHVKTGELLKKVLLGSKIPPVLVGWTEFWEQMINPNLMVEVPVEILKLQMTALSEHKGEVNRNPFHLRLPAWMMDNVRRGSELITGAGTSAPKFAFGVLHRMQLFKNGKLVTPKLDPYLEAHSNIAHIFKLILEAASGSSTRVK